MNAKAHTVLIGLMGAVALGSCGEERPHPPDQEIRTEPSVPPSTAQPAIATDTSLPNIRVTPPSDGGVDGGTPGPQPTEGPKPLPTGGPRPLSPNHLEPLSPRQAQPQPISPQQAQPIRP